MGEVLWSEEREERSEVERGGRAVFMEAWDQDERRSRREGGRDALMFCFSLVGLLDFGTTLHPLAMFQASTTAAGVDLYFAARETTRSSVRRGEVAPAPRAAGDRSEEVSLLSLRGKSGRTRVGGHVDAFALAVLVELEARKVRMSLDLCEQGL